jgi:hypothetical protein
MRLLAALLLCCSFALGATKPEPVYQDAVFKDFHYSQTGQSCTTSGGSNGTVDAHTNSSGHTSGTVNTTSSATTDCSINRMALYTITAGEHEYVITPRHLPFSGSPIAAAFRKNSDLYGVLPGTPLKIRTESENFYVKIGNRESVFKLVSAK